MNPNGVTQKDFKFLLDFCVKANDQQLELARKHINSEVIKREMAKLLKENQGVINYGKEKNTS